MRRRSLLRGSAVLPALFFAGRGTADSQLGDPTEQLLKLDAGATRYIVSTTDKPVEDVIADVEFSIAEFNYRLTSRNNVGYAIADRDPSANKRVARIFHFCNIQIAEQLLAAGDEYLLHMPCRLVVWQAQEVVWVAARLLPSSGRADQALVLKINNMMRAIADFSIET